MFNIFNVNIISGLDRLANADAGKPFEGPTKNGVNEEDIRGRVF